MTKFSPTPHIYGHTHIYIGKHCWSLWLWNINAMDLIVQFYPWQCESKLTIFFSAGGRRWTWCLGLIVIHMINDFEECPTQEQSCGMKSTVLVVRLGGIPSCTGHGRMWEWYCLLSYCCGTAQPNSCPVGERLVGACSHCVVALTLSAVYPGNPNLFSSTHRGVRLLDRRNPQQMDIATVA